jgi:hypothetical protein
MKIKLISPLPWLASCALILLLAACKNEGTGAKQAQSSTFQADRQQALVYKDLSLIPIVAEEDFLQANNASAELSTLDEVIQEPKFRITERVDFGHNDEGHINALTIQNKTDHSVYLMEGEVVTGGKQDRVLAEEVIVAERSLKNIEVFCVEQDRWQYDKDQKQVESSDDQIYAFRGHFKLASSQVRQAVRSGNQNKVWEQVAEVRKANEVQHKTKTYAGLSSSERFKNQQKQYLLALEDGFANNKKVVGVIAISGNKLVGADLFGSNELFRKQFKTLLHGYATDAISKPGDKEFSEKQLKEINEKINAVETQKQGFRFKNQLVHYALI